MLSFPREIACNHDCRGNQFGIICSFWDNLRTLSGTLKVCALKVGKEEGLGRFRYLLRKFELSLVTKSLFRGKVIQMWLLKTVLKLSTDIFKVGFKRSGRVTSMSVTPRYVAVRQYLGLNSSAMTKVSNVQTFFLDKTGLLKAFGSRTFKFRLRVV